MKLYKFILVGLSTAGIVTILAVLFPLLLPSVSAARSPASGNSISWLLPLLLDKQPASNTNPVHSGNATYYSADGDGACMFGPSPDDLMVAALDSEEFDNAIYCGAYLRVSGPLGQITVRVVDSCPAPFCETGHLDLSTQAFEQIGDPLQGIVPITWQVISPPVPGPIAYHIRETSNEWYIEVQIRNHRNPISKLEYLKGDDQWVEMRRTDYNYFTLSNPGPGPYTFRVTDWYGNQLTDSGIQLSAGDTIDGAAQFPVGP